MNLIDENPTEREIWYRIDDRDVEHNGYTREVVLVTREIPVVRHTEKGVWLDDYGLLRFVLKGDGKRFAYPTLEAALDSFKRRKERQVMLLKATLGRAEAALAFAKVTTADQLQLNHKTTSAGFIDPLGHTMEVPLCLSL